MTCLLTLMWCSLLVALYLCSHLIKVSIFDLGYLLKKCCCCLRYSWWDKTITPFLLNPSLHKALMDRNLCYMFRYSPGCKGVLHALHFLFIYWVSVIKSEQVYSVQSTWRLVTSLCPPFEHHTETLYPCFAPAFFVFYFCFSAPWNTSPSELLSLWFITSCFSRALGKRERSQIPLQSTERWARVHSVHAFFITLILTEISARVGHDGNKYFIISRTAAYLLVGSWWIGAHAVGSLLRW